MRNTLVILIGILVIIGLCECSGQINSKKEAENEQSKSSGTDAKNQQDIETNYNGHEYVDLGLPSGLKWATCNVGASAPEEYGNYYAWGDTIPKSSYDEENCVTYGKSESELKSAGIINSAGNLTMSYDAARANWGGSWRMPSEKELEELVDKCTWTWTSQGGYDGYRVTGPNGNSIFLPEAGYRFGALLNYAGESGFYWSSTCLDDIHGAYGLTFDSSDWHVGQCYRYGGLSVRPVTE